ncbi:MAG: phytoene desaturase family protein, partial [Methyloceanibacter sp.]
MLTLAPTQRQSARLEKPGRHAIVIGSGLGGLAAAIRLGARGYRVTVLEKLDGPGGRAYVFEQDGFRFDAGPTIITAPFLLKELWALVGRELSQDVDLRPLDPFYRIRFHDGEVLDCFAGEEDMRAEVARISPKDVEGFEAFMCRAEEIYRIGFERFGAIPFGNFRDMIKVLPEFVRLASYENVHGFVSRYVKDPRLRFALSFHPLFVGGNPFKVTSIYGLIAFLERRHGVHFAMGGTGRIVQGMVGLIQRQGNEVRYGAEVSEIIVENGAATGVQLSSGERIKSDIVVSNADTAWTYRKLVPPSARKRWSDKKIDRANYSMGLFVWYFGTSR